MIKIIESHFKNINFDIKISRDARFMDQKVTPDVLCIIADSVLEFVKDDKDKEFTTKDIWESDYANQNIKDIFNKPDVLNKKAKSEYDKFFAQPLKMLSYAGILSLIKKGNRNYFTVNNQELLKFISIKERNALDFITIYLKKVLIDSGISEMFNNFFVQNDSQSFRDLKANYEQFIIDNTPINGRTEVRRIFTKILNPLAYSQKKYGTKGGFLSPDIIGYDELMYNRRNWRDIEKLRGETREEHEERAKALIEIRKNAFSKFTMEKAKRLIRDRHQSISEVQDDLAVGNATNVHHIFPRAEYPQIEAFLENLILLTATQHSTKAHPNNRTREIDKDYQLVCLLAKSNSIAKSINSSDGFYSKEDFMFVLNKGLNPQKEFIETNSFEEINQKLSSEYHKI